MDDPEEAWRWLLAARQAARSGCAAIAPATAATGDAGALVDLLLPLAAAGPGRPFALGHLGQSLDGHIATGSGASHYVTGRANILHLHRLRALCDAVLVGAGTVGADDPRLTTRHVPGPNPVRVVIDRERRLGCDAGLFHDGAAPTLILCAPDCALAAAGGAETVGLADLSPCGIRRALAARGLNVLLVEGGGRTVSGFLAAGALDRLHVAVAPMIIGSGVPGLRLPPIEGLEDALRPPCRIYPMGEDVLFDLDLAAGRR